MSLSVRKLIAVLLAVWLPLFSGSVLAASVSMQLHNGAHVAMQTMQQGDHCEQHMGSSSDPAAMSDHHGCATCAVCHLACSAYLAVSHPDELAMQQSGAAVDLYLLSFNSILSIPLLPPPLA
jgi:hypothetical protein